MSGSEWFKFRSGGYVRYGNGGTGIVFTPSGFVSGAAVTLRCAFGEDERIPMPAAFNDIRQGLLAMVNTETNPTMAGVLASLADLYT